MAAQGETFVIAVGDRALKAALTHGGDRLGDRAEFKAIAGKLTGGAKPSFYLDMQQVTSLVRAFAGSGPQATQALDVLRRFTQVAAGGTSQDDVSRTTIVAGVKTQ